MIFVARPLHFVRSDSLMLNECKKKGSLPSDKNEYNAGAEPEGRVGQNNHRAQPGELLRLPQRPIDGNGLRPAGVEPQLAAGTSAACQPDPRRQRSAPEGHAPA